MTTLHRTFIIGAAAVLAACGQMPMSQHGGMTTASATLEPTRGNQVTGEVQFEQRPAGVLVRATVSGLAPGSIHGFHVHEKGDCSSGDGMSAGGHFNPQGVAHGYYQAAVHHAGDMPNLQADTQGQARMIFELKGVQLTTGPDGLIGKGVIVHSGPDDYVSQPTGNAGGRLACGVIVQR